MPDVTDTFYPADAIHGYATQWLIGKGDVVPGPETFEAIPFVKTIQPGEMSTDVLDKTHLRSPGAHREKKAGLRDTGPFAIQLFWNPNHESQSMAGGGTGAFMEGGLMHMWSVRSEHNFKLVLPDGDPGTEWPFRGTITKCQPGEIGEDSLIMLDVEVQPLMDISADLP
jgi:hypothetical protein